MSPLNQAQAAKYLNMDVKTFRVHVRPYVPRINLGRKMLFLVKDLDRWLDTNAR